MKKLHLLLLPCAFATLTSCAEMAYRADVGAMFPVARGQVALQNAAGDLPLGENQNDLETNLGLGETEASPYVHLQGDKGRHRVRVHGFLLDAEGSGTLSGAFGGIAAGSQVTSSMEFLSVQANYSFEVLRDEHYRVALGGILGFYGLDLAARSTAGREEVETSVLVPMPYVEAELLYGPVILGGGAGLMAFDLGDANGRYGDVEAYLRVRPEENFQLMAGYRFILLDAYGRASSRDFDADLEVSGFFFGGGIRF